jgi:hypothetical protein
MYDQRAKVQKEIASHVLKMLNNAIIAHIAINCAIKHLRF